MHPLRNVVLCAAMSGVVFAPWISRSSLAQGTSGPVVSDSKVGYIDCALPANVARLRFDASYENRRPTRAEFFYPQGAPRGPGLPQPETRVDYQDINAYTEFLLDSRWSVFCEAATRFLNPDINENTAGLGDLQVGFKHALLAHEMDVTSFQLRAYVPTGDADRGLGTDHVSLEPAVLYYEALSDRTGVEGEVRVWVPIGGTEFAGPLLRYGMGIHHQLVDGPTWSLSPVAELVGWTVLDGQESQGFADGTSVITDATGDTIVNFKLGTRLSFRDGCDLYGGWGHALTGDAWYANTLRLEWRCYF